MLTHALVLLHMFSLCLQCSSLCCMLIEPLSHPLSLSSGVFVKRPWSLHIFKYLVHGLLLYLLYYSVPVYFQALRVEQVALESRGFVLFIFGSQSRLVLDI